METTEKQTIPQTFSLPDLPYPKDSLEPFIDAKTMEIHHDKHHGAYVSNLNNAIANTDAQNMSLEEILNNVSKFSAAIRNNAGGHYNHNLFWSIMKPHAGGSPSGKLVQAITQSFGSYEEFKNKFVASATGRFGSGWTWLIKNQAGQLEITSTANQDNPLMDIADTKGYPLLALDVWEHAYYLKYQYRRADYISAWWHVVNWNEVEQRFQKR